MNTILQQAQPSAASSTKPDKPPSTSKQQSVPLTAVNTSDLKSSLDQLTKLAQTPPKEKEEKPASNPYAALLTPADQKKSQSGLSALIPP